MVIKFTDELRARETLGFEKTEKDYKRRVRIDRTRKALAGGRL